MRGLDLRTPWATPVRMRGRLKIPAMTGANGQGKRRLVLFRDPGRGHEIG
jgi:hypothetical protein